MAERIVINNSFYDDLGERWYEASDDPVALLRAENRRKLEWIRERLAAEEDFVLRGRRVLDVGCGAGFLANALAADGAAVTGVDLSESSLEVARRHDATRRAHYVKADAYALPFEDRGFDVVTCLDFLEHVERPEAVIAEAARVLKPGGLFFFHTFNRNFLSYLVVIKGVEWFVKNTPRHMHLYSLFVKPEEVENSCRASGLRCEAWTGLRPRLTKAFWQMLARGVVPESFEFDFTPSLAVSYIGVARKES